VIAPHIRIDGFDALAWGRLLSLVTGLDPERPPAEREAAAGDAQAAATGEGAGSARAYGTLVIVEDAEERALAAFQTRRGPIPVQQYTGRTSLAALCAEHGAERAVCVRQETVPVLLQRASQALDLKAGYVAQWLTLASVARQLSDEGLLYLWPPPKRRMPLSSERMLERALDLLLPEGYALALVLWQGTELWTGAALRRRGSAIDWMAGPDRLRAWTGPLGGDWRRDHLVIGRAVSRAVAPLHCGIYAQAGTLQSLLRDPDPGAWARAIVVRDLIIHPAPPYVGVAVGADAFRAVAAHSSRWLRGLDLTAALAPIAHFARSHVDQIASVRDLLGFSPLEQLGAWLRRHPPDAP
jgi:hypothetical protein